MKRSELDVVTTVSLAAAADVANLTNDRIKALTGGHGMVNMAIHTAANVIAEDVIRGQDISISNADRARLPVSDMMEKAIKAAKKAGADGANAALIVAGLMYFAGSKAQVGIPAGNRKLGATCRMLAGVDRSGVAAVPTAKMNSKISGFAAVKAIYDALEKGELTEIDGKNVPAFIGASPIYGHSKLGEDIVWPQLAENGARIGTEAMMKAMRGAGMEPHALTSALLGSAAILEIIHPDAEVPESEGEYGRTTSVYLVGRTAAETAGLPEELTMKVTGEKFKTAQVVGDIGLILKDIGGPSVIGMMALNEILSCFEEMVAGFSGTPLNSPIGHIGTYANIAMQMLIDNGGQQEEVAEKIREERQASNVDPESSITTINIISRKSNEIYPGPVTQTLIKASEAPRNVAIMKRAKYAYHAFMEGKTIEEVIESLEKERIEKVAQNASTLFTNMYGKEVRIEVLDLYTGARREAPVARKYLAFDGSGDFRVTIDGQTEEFENFAVEGAVEFAKGNKENLAEYAPVVGLVLNEFLLGSVYTVDFIIPVAVKAAIDDLSEEEIKELAKQANKVALISGGIPGSNPRSRSVANLTLKMLRLQEEQ